MTLPSLDLKVLIFLRKIRTNEITLLTLLLLLIIPRPVGLAVLKDTQEIHVLGKESLNIEIGTKNRFLSPRVP